MEWLRTARPLFTTLGPNVPWTRATIDARVGSAVEDGCDTIMAFVQDEGYALWPSRHAPVAPRAGGLDLVGEWVASTHAAGLRFVAQWMGVHVQTVQMARHPSWLQRDASGTATAAMCLNSPFGDALAGQVREVVESYPVDGIYFDGLYARAGGCRCDACLARFEELHGRRLERSDDDGARGGRPGQHWLAFGSGASREEPDEARFRFDTVTWYLARIASIVRSARAGTAIILDTHGLGGAYWPNAQDPGALRPYVDAFALECYPDQVSEPLWHASVEADLLAAEGDRPLWMLRWIARDPDADLVSVPPATVEAQVATALITQARPTIVEMNLYAVDRTLGPTVASGMATAARLDAWRADAERLCWAAVLVSAETRWTAAAAGRSRRAYDPLAGAWLTLTEAHLPVTFVTDRAVLAGELPVGIEVLVVPDVPRMGRELTDAILRMVGEDGLGLVATYRTGLEDDDGLLARLGLRHAGVGHRAGRIGTESIGGRELVTFVSLAEGHPITAGLDGRPLSFAGGFLRLTETEGSTLGAIHDSDFTAMDGERWFGWLGGEPSSAAGVALERGPGRVVYWSIPLETVFFRNGRPEMAALLAASCRWAARRAPAIAVDAPVTVEARAWRGSEGITVVLANRTTNDLYAIGAGVAVGAATSSGAGAGGSETTLRSQLPRVVIPIADVAIELPWEGSVVTVETASGAPAAATASDGRARILLSRLGAYEAILIR
jgi:hypothetical protein